MKNPAQMVASFVDELLAGRRPPRFPVESESADALRVAAALAAGRPGVDAPSPRFVADLHRRLSKGLSEPTSIASSRRRFFARWGLPAAAALAGGAFATGMRAAVDRLGADTDNDDDLVPTGAGVWTPVAPVAGIAPGQPLRFTLGPLIGYLVTGAQPQEVSAVSAVCTHMGCLLDANSAAGRLDCLCHGASFALDGTPLSRIYTRSLPRLRARVNGDVVEVYAPADQS